LIKAALFDVGDTLFVPEKPWLEVMPEALLAIYAYAKENGLPVTPETFLEHNRAVFERYVELENDLDTDMPDLTKYQYLLRELFSDRSEEEVTAMAARMNDIFWSMLNANWTLSPEALECLQDLRSMGIVMGIISNHHNHEALLKLLAANEISDYFTIVLTSEREGIRKPNPEIFKICLSQMGLRPSEAVFIGDSVERDAAGARASGITSILIHGGIDATNSESDFYIESLTEVPTIIQKLNGN
jgi:HAD superfamily hydrolase (TIGR01549 family)